MGSVQYAWPLALGAMFLGGNASAQNPDLRSLLADVKAVGKEGAGHAQAMQAWKKLVGLGPEAAPGVLAGLDDASPLAANWIRSAYETIVDRAVAAGKAPSTADLEAFLKDTRHAGIARRLAYETLTRLDPKSVDRLLPTFLEDPGIELRRDAVDLLLKAAQKDWDAKNLDAAKTTYSKALSHARERDQVTLIAERLKKTGVDVDLVKQFGFVTQWAIIGPFENSKGVGFEAVYGPENGVDLKGDLPGKDGKKVTWSGANTDHAMGIVDLNKAVAPLKGAVEYAYALVDSPTDQPVEIRCGSNNAVRIRLNGKEIYFREEYHHGMQMDQHVGKGVLKAGRNEILIKVCQNEQTDSWAQLWSFQLRICDHLGGPVPFTTSTPKLTSEGKR